ncbi:hypothetical protein OFM21_30175, partial [Escherichia coli]|nr:hypothetical protein [Escherichia coli]
GEEDPTVLNESLLKFVKTSPKLKKLHIDLFTITLPWTKQAPQLESITMNACGIKNEKEFFRSLCKGTSTYNLHNNYGTDCDDYQLPRQ